MKTIRLSLCSVYLLAATATGCASFQRAAVAENLRDGAVAQLVYRLPEAQIWVGVENLLLEEGYQQVGVPSLNGILRTHWSCTGSSCNSLEVTVTPAGPDAHQVTVQRTSYEISDSIVPQTAPALDFEWTLARRLDPADAQAIEIAAQNGARELVQNQ